MYEQYSKQIQSCVEKGYAVKVSTKEKPKNEKKKWYLLHFSVVNPNKPNKFRFVFDAAAKSCGQSLNDQLLTGPDLFNSIIGILFKLPQYKIAFVGDIKEMFLRVKIIKKDQVAQIFLWREKGSDKEPEEMVMTSMIFGAVCSPTCATFVIRKNTERFSENCPETVKRIHTQFYMDDYLDSYETVEEATCVANQIIEICEAGAFNIRNFISNSPEFLQSLPETKRSNAAIFDVAEENSIERVLGLSWNFQEDA